MRQKLNGINNIMLALPSGVIVTGPIVQVMVPRVHIVGRDGTWNAGPCKTTLCASKKLASAWVIWNPLRRQCAICISAKCIAQPVGLQRKAPGCRACPITCPPYVVVSHATSGTTGQRPGSSPTAGSHWRQPICAFSPPTPLQTIPWLIAAGEGVAV